MIDGIKQLADMGASNVVIFVILALSTVSAMIQLFNNLTKGVGEICKRYGLKNKWTTKEEQRNALIQEHECRFNNIDVSLKKLQEQRVLDVRESKEHDKRIENQVTAIADILLEERIDNKRSAILNFSNALQNGKRMDKEQFDFVFIQYDKYEKILEDHNLENGQVTASMEFIRKTYQEKLKNGF